jgi:hypothetical protein
MVYGGFLVFAAAFAALAGYNTGTSSPQFGAQKQYMLCCCQPVELDAMMHGPVTIPIAVPINATLIVITFVDLGDGQVGICAWYLGDSPSDCPESMFICDTPPFPCGTACNGDDGSE